MTEHPVRAFVNIKNAYCGVLPSELQPIPPIANPEFAVLVKSKLWPDQSTTKFENPTAGSYVNDPAVGAGVPVPRVKLMS